MKNFTPSANVQYMELIKDIINWAKETLKDHPDLSFAIMAISLLSGMTPTIFLFDISTPQAILIAIIIVAILIITCFALYVFQERGKARKREDSENSIIAIDRSFNVEVQNR